MSLANPDGSSSRPQYAQDVAYNELERRQVQIGYVLSEHLRAVDGPILVVGIGAGMDIDPQAAYVAIHSPRQLFICDPHTGDSSLRTSGVSESIHVIGLGNAPRYLKQLQLLEEAGLTTGAKIKWLGPYIGVENLLEYDERGTPIRKDERDLKLESVGTIIDHGTIGCIAGITAGGDNQKKILFYTEVFKQYKDLLQSGGEMFLQGLEPLALKVLKEMEGVTLKIISVDDIHRFTFLQEVQACLRDLSKQESLDDPTKRLLILLTQTPGMPIGIEPMHSLPNLVIATKI